LKFADQEMYVTPPETTKAGPMVSQTRYYTRDICKVLKTRDETAH
jgi:hypothetical protein